MRQKKKTTGFLLFHLSKVLQEQSHVIGVIIKGAIGAGIFILLIILVNLINLNTSGSIMTRSKEVAVRTNDWRK